MYRFFSVKKNFGGIENKVENKASLIKLVPRPFEIYNPRRKSG